MAYFALIQSFELFRRNIIGSPFYSCRQVENFYYVFFSCNLYKQARNRLLNELLKIDQIDIFDNHCLLRGNEILPEFLNKKKNAVLVRKPYQIICNCQFFEPRIFLRMQNRVKEHKKLKKRPET